MTPSPPPPPNPGAGNGAGVNQQQAPPPRNNTGYSNPPPSSGAPSAHRPSTTPVLLDVTSLQNSYNEMLTAGSQPKILTDMFGMLVQVVSKQNENDIIKEEVRDNSNRIKELEAKVGGPDSISEKVGLAIRNLPFPAEGASELDNVREALNEIKAPGVNTGRDVVKAIRFGSSDTYLGTVKVEMIDDPTRASIMKSKKNLAFHHNPIMRDLVVKNLKSENQMSLENFARDLLKMVPGGSDVFMAANGHLRQRGAGQQGAGQQGAGQQGAGQQDVGHQDVPAQGYRAPPQYGLPPRQQYQRPQPVQPAAPRMATQVRQPHAQPPPRSAAPQAPQAARPQRITLNYPTNTQAFFSQPHPYSYAQASMRPSYIPVSANLYSNPVPSTSSQPNPLDMFDPLSQFVIPAMDPAQYHQLQAPAQQQQPGEQELSDSEGDRVAAQVIQQPQ